VYPFKDLMMKKYFILFLVSITGLTGCYELDTQPFDKVSSTSFWQTEEHALQGVMGVYAQLKHDNVYGTSFLFDNLSDIAIGFDPPAYEAAFNGNYTDRTGFVVNHWKSTYDGVQRANNAIANIQSMDIDEENKKVLVAEAKFLRALFYFHLLDFYGGVPLYDEAVNLNEDFNNLMNPRSSEQEVRDFILADLNEAINNLPVSYDESHRGRATKGAAYALRGKIYLYNQEWKSAISDFEEIVNNVSADYGYSLYPNYADLFKLEGHDSNEMVFAIQNKGGVGFPYGMPLAFYLGTRSTFGSSWNNGMPSNALADMYENKDGSRFNWDEVVPGFTQSNEVKEKTLLATQVGGEILTLPDTALLGEVYRNRDPRLMATIIVPYSTYLGWNANAPREMRFIVATGVNENFGQIRNNRGWTTYFWRKFVPEGNLNGEISNRAHTPFNFPLIRYADVLLMLAEAYNEDGQLNKAVTEVNKVRERSAMPGLNSGPAWLQVSNKDQMFERIMHERAVELASEGHRFSDLRRWGLAEEMLSGKVEKGLLGSNLFTRSFTDRDYLWPIPAQEIEINPGLNQNPGW
jgi:tetratricopeptide (TPR) repeat protein